MKYKVTPAINALYADKTIEDYIPYIGKKCRKKDSRCKPFKSKLKVNTVKGVINHPILNIPAYTFIEDDSYVECRRVRIIGVGNSSIIRAGIVNLNILPELKGKEKDNIYVEMFGVPVKMTSQRYAVFQKSIKCCDCGLTGQYFAAENTEKSSPNYHLNLYAINEAGEEVLMTKDHIFAVANGGKNSMSNYRTMCQPCNHAKGKKII